MKQKVKYSLYSLIITAIVLIASIVGIFSLRHNIYELIPFCIIFGAITIFGLYYCPKSVEADKAGVAIHRVLSSPKVFQYDNIESVDTCYPSPGGLRLFGSGGCFGYWGYFNDILIGTYFAYYGSRSSCFLLKLKNGKQYVLGCEDAREMVNYISERIK